MLEFQTEMEAYLFLAILKEAKSDQFLNCFNK